MKEVDLSIVLSKYNQADAEKIFSRRIRVVSNGIPDPCPNFREEVLPRRKARFAERVKLAQNNRQEHEVTSASDSPELVRVLYLAHCTHEKGLFDSLDAVRIANERLLKSDAPFRLRLMVAGTFVNADEKSKFDRQLANPTVAAEVEYYGFVSGTKKNQLLREADLFCFPTYYQNENQPVNVIEAMAFGLPILTTRWRSLPELFPRDYLGLVEVRSPEQIARKLIELITSETGEGFRDMFLQSFTLEKHLASLSDAFLSTQRPAPEATGVGLARATS